MTNRGCTIVYNTIAAVVNFFLTVGWLSLFERLGWLAFSADTGVWRSWLAVVLIFWAVGTTVGLIFDLYAFLGCSAVLLLYPVFWVAVGLVLLTGFSGTDSFTLQPTAGYLNFWLMAIAFGLIRFPLVNASNS